MGTPTSHDAKPSRDVRVVKSHNKAMNSDFLFLTILSHHQLLKANFPNKKQKETRN